MSGAVLSINDARYSADGVDPSMTLLAFLRSRGLVGTKEGCAEGECGACAVVWREATLDGKSRFVAVNACLVPALACLGRDVWTVEGVADGETLHPVQAAMVELGGSQCGYCTPGFVMSLFAEHYRRGRTSFDPESIAGNLCRCTGYRPIRDAGRRLPVVDASDRFARRLERPVEAPRTVSLSIDEDLRFDRPATLADALELLRDHPTATVVAGGTDLFVERNLRHRRFTHVVAIDGIAELARIEEERAAFAIGAGASLSDVEARLGGAIPMLRELLPLFSSRLIRNRATLGGNLLTASPIGDSAPALLALGAKVVLASAADGEREVALDAFFTGYRTTNARPGELLVRVIVPRPLPRVQRFFKVSKREHDDISSVAAGMCLELDEARRVVHARFGWGGVAATPVRVPEAEGVLLGRAWTADALVPAKEALARALEPIGDHRASAAYRRAMVPALLDKLLAETS